MRYVWCFLCVLFCGLVFAQQTHGSTIAYWRYESGDLTADSVNGFDGNNYNASATDPGAESGSDSGSGLWDPIPNPDKPAWDGNSSYGVFGGGDAVWVEDDPAWEQSQAFTVEAMTRFGEDGVNEDSALVSNWTSGSGLDKSWQFGLSSNEKPFLRLWDSSTSSGTVITPDASISALSPNTAYALAASWQDDGNVTLFARASGASSWQKYTEGSGITSLADSEALLSMGSNSDQTDDFFVGDMDEVRFSSEALGEAELLATPEPGTTCLALVAAAAGVFAVWRKKSKENSEDEAA